MERTINKNRRHWFAAGLLLILCFVTYSNSLSNNFTVDDYEMLIGNSQMHNIKFLLKNFSITSKSQDYRIFPHIISMLNYLWFGSNPFGHHIVMLILFYICGITLYVLLNMLFQDWKIAFLSSLFFIAHPINGLLVNYTAGACSALLFPINLSIIFFLLASSKRRWFYLSMSLIWFSVALLSHESTIMYPLYLAAVLFFVKKYNLKETLRGCFPYILLVCAYVIFRMHFISLKIHIFDKVFLLKVSIFSYIASFTKIILWYVAKLVFLKDIVLMWFVPTVTQNLIWWNLGFWVGLVLYFYWLFFVLKGNIRFFGLVWFSIGLVPLTVACFYRSALGFVIEPHWMSFSTIGFLIFLADLIVAVTRNKKIWLSILTSFFLMSYIFVSRQHNKLWADKKTYCQYWVKVVPQNLLGIGFLADAYYMNGEVQKAEELYYYLSSRGWERAESYDNLGLIEMSRGNTTRAIQDFRRALELKPSKIAYTNLGIALSKIGDLAGSQEAYIKAIELNPFSVEARYNLALAYREQKEFVKAKSILEKILEIDPNDEPTMFLLAQITWESGDKSAAFSWAKTILLKGKDPQRLTELGSLFAANHYSNMAFALYSRALEKDPQNKTAHLELGKLYGNQGQYNRAIVIWQQGLRYHPEEKMFIDFIQDAKRLKEK